ncbi:hypothetical protein ACFY3V_04505 [Streptosporangium sp. NPDC000095]|uniref:hypothetical protein n=1 Tax=Streptosporangium sp. NPDC000095 TaxID=3366184 RepID=UPI0036A456DE
MTAVRPYRAALYSSIWVKADRPASWTLLATLVRVGSPPKQVTYRLLPEVTKSYQLACGKAIPL